MPVENERKYILALSPTYIDALVKEYPMAIHQDISQAYIGSARIRATQNRVNYGNETYNFTWKRRRADESRIEIETQISLDDFNELWQMSKKVITKQRVKIKGNVDWDIDFLFKGDDNTDISSYYLTIAEVEMPTGWDEPPTLPAFVQDNLLYLVPRSEDHKWTNPNLTDPAKVKKMLDKALGSKS